MLQLLQDLLELITLTPKRILSFWIAFEVYGIAEFFLENPVRSIWPVFSFGEALIDDFVD